MAKTKGIPAVVPLKQRKKRLKSLDEFEPPPWKGRFRLAAPAPSRAPLALTALIGVVAGGLLGWILAHW